MAQIRWRRSRVAAANRERVRNYLQARSCADCGEDDWVVLEFDHLRDKSAGVAELVAGGYRWESVLEEIEKCEVVCANCHHRRTYDRAKSWRVAGIAVPTRPVLPPLRRIVKGARLVEERGSSSMAEQRPFKS